MSELNVADLMKQKIYIKSIKIIIFIIILGRMVKKNKHTILSTFIYFWILLPNAPEAFIEVTVNVSDQKREKDQKRTAYFTKCGNASTPKPFWADFVG